MTPEVSTQKERGADALDSEPWHSSWACSPLPDIRELFKTLLDVDHSDLPLVVGKAVRMRLALTHPNMVPSSSPDFTVSLQWLVTSETAKLEPLGTVVKVREDNLGDRSKVYIAEGLVRMGEAAESLYIDLSVTPLMNQANLCVTLSICLGNGPFELYHRADIKLPMERNPELGELVLR